MMSREALVTLGWLHLITASCWSVQRCPDHCSCSEDTSSNIAESSSSSTSSSMPLYSIDCAEQSLTSFPEMLPMCQNSAATPGGYHLNFSHNNLSELINETRSLPLTYLDHYLSRTEVLDLSHNQLRTVSGLLEIDLSRLRIIYLHDNQLTHLEDEFLRQLPLHLSISLKGNPWQCACGLQTWLKASCTDNECTVMDKADIQCWKDTQHMSMLQVDLKCTPHKKQTIPTYISAIIGLVLFYLLGCAFAAICIVIRNRHKVKASAAAEVQLE